MKTSNLQVGRFYTFPHYQEKKGENLIFISKVKIKLHYFVGFNNKDERNKVWSDWSSDTRPMEELEYLNQDCPPEYIEQIYKCWFGEIYERK